MKTDVVFTHFVLITQQYSRIIESEAYEFILLSSSKAINKISYIFLVSKKLNYALAAKN